MDFTYFHVNTFHSLAPFERGLRDKDLTASHDEGEYPQSKEHSGVRYWPRVLDVKGPRSNSIEESRQ